MDKKILILTLGTGSGLERETFNELKNMSKEERNTELRRIYKSDEFVYRNANYVMTKADGTQASEKSAFVASPLIKMEEPDQIFIIGTARSSWSGFYKYFARERKEGNYLKLFDIEATYNMDTDMTTLADLSKTIEDIYREDGMFEDIIGKPTEVHILLVRYGVDQQQLEENYQIISRIDKVLEEDKKHFNEEVKYFFSFDITHSFRSLPLYNLIILHYIRHITRHNVEISHVYYGNLDVAGETKGKKAYIVDLRDLVGVLELTNGVGEFRDTGNCVALLNELDKDEADLKPVLETFDWATQMNDFQAIIDSLSQMFSTVGQREENSPYADLADMLHRVLSEEFISPKQLEEYKDIEQHPEYVGELQVCITKWYQSQNRYGLAIATGLEALRSLLVPIWLQQYGKKGSGVANAVNLDACKNEDNRRAAEDKLRELTDIETISRDSEAMLLLQNLAEPLSDVKGIRNRFAHNLLPSQEDEASNPNKTTENNSALEDKRKIDDFITNLVRLNSALRCTEGKLNAKTIKNAYLTRPQNPRAEQVSGDNILIIISTENNDSSWQGYKKSNKKEYDVYVLPNDMIRYVRAKNEANKLKKPTEVINDAFMVAKYINHYFDAGNVTVVLWEDLEHLQKVYFPLIFKERGINNVQLGRSCVQPTRGRIQSGRSYVQPKRSYVQPKRFDIPNYVLEIDYDSRKTKAEEKFDKRLQKADPKRL